MEQEKLLRHFHYSDAVSYTHLFADPPYNLEKINDIPAAILNNDLLAPDGIAVIEHPSSVDFSSEPNFFEHRQYGLSLIHIS